MTTYAQVKQMRLDHGAGCSDPPDIVKGIYFGWKDSKRSEKVAIPALTDPFDIFLCHEVHNTHVPGNLL